MTQEKYQQATELLEQIARVKGTLYYWKDSSCVYNLQLKSTRSVPSVPIDNDFFEIMKLYHISLYEKRLADLQTQFNNL